jgi:hypothetical protein
MSKSKVELTAETIGKAIEDGHFSSMTQLAHSMGYKGSVSSSLTKKFRQLIPNIDARLASNKPVKDAGKTMAGKPSAQATKPAPRGKADKTVKAVRADKPVPKPAGAKGGKFARDPRNPFREGSTYGLVFDVLASYPDGIEREMLVRLVAAETKKDLVHAGYDCQVLLSARGNEPGLSRNDGPRHRSCRNGFWVERTNGHVKLVVDKE